MSKNIFALGNRSFIIYLAFLSAFAPLSTDLFLPALPRITENLNTYEGLSTLSISGFLLLFALSMLLWGPLSDTYGRKPILYSGIVLYIASSVAIALVTSIYPLLLFRAFQAVASGAVSAMSLAIVKDVFRGQVLEKVVGWVQTLTILAPMLAPVLGGLILQYMNWRGIFWCLALCGIVALAGALLLQETHIHPVQRTPLESVCRICIVLKNKNFSVLLGIFSVMCMPMMVYIATSSYIFQTMFHLSAQQYSAFFAFNASICMAGPLLHGYVLSKWNLHTLIACHMLVVCIGGLLLLFFGANNAFAFALLFAPVSFCTSAIRPPSTILLLRQLDGDSGTVTALINSVGLLFGSMGMLVCSLPFWTSFVAAAACITFCTGALTLLAWLRLDRCHVLQAENARP